MIESYLLEYFLAVYREGTVSRAADKLHVSQPSVTKALQKLESELDLPLFERTPNRLLLNENGRIVADYVKNIEMLQERLKEKAAELKRKSLTIRVDATAPGPTFQYPDFFFFREAENPCEFQMKDEKRCIEDVLSGLADIAFVNAPVAIDGLYCEKAFTESLYVSIPKTHFLAHKKDGVTFAELDGQSFLIVRDLGVWHRLLEEKLPNSKFYRLDSSQISDLIEASTIPSFVSNITFAIRQSRERIFLPILDEGASKDFYVVGRADKKGLFMTIKSLGQA